VNAKYIIGIIIIAAFVIWGMSTFMTKTVRYISLADVPQSQGTVQVMGKIDFEVVDYDAENSKLIFDILDLEEPESGRRLKIIYGGVVPGNFEQATSIVAIGNYHDGAFHADQLLVKCPSKYQGMDQEA
jgi:cytochrome c-type biogenesis protein CcmE